MKLAILTIRGVIEYNKACVDSCLVLSRLPLRCVGVAAEPVGSFVHVDIMIGSVERPESGDTCAAAANNGDFFSSKCVRHVIGVQWRQWSVMRKRRNEDKLSRAVPNK